MIKTTTLLFLIICPFIAYSQPQWINCTNGNHVNDIVLDDEILWIATDGGVVRLDRLSGEKTFFNRSNTDIPTNDITSMVVDNDGRIWIASSSFYTSCEGIAYYDGEEWTRIDDICGVLAKDNNGDILILSRQKLYRFNGGEFSSVDIPFGCTIPTDLAISPANGDIWMTFYDFGCYSTIRYDGSEFELFDSTNSPLPFESPTQNSLFIDESGRVWKGAWNRVFVYEDGDFTQYNIDNSAIPSGQVTSIVKDDNGLIWVGIDSYSTTGVANYGLASFDGENWQAYEQPSEFMNAHKTNILLMVDDHILLGTEGGLFDFDLESYEYIPSSNSALASNWVKSILQNGNETWVGAGNSNPSEYRDIIKITGENWAIFNSSNSPFTTDKVIELMDIDNEGHIYVQNDDNIYFYDGTNWTLYELPDLVEDVIESRSQLRFDNNNKPWLFNYSGYIFYQNEAEEWTIVEPTEHGNISGSYLGIDFSPTTNDLWFGSYGGLYHFDGNEWTSYTDFGLQTNNSYVNDVKIDDNDHIWIACTNGIAKFDGNTFTPYPYQEIGLENYHTFRSITVDHQGHIWAGTDNILVEFDGENWEVYNTQNSGLPNGTIYSLSEDGNNNMWIGTDNGGFAIFNEEGIQDQEHTAVFQANETLPLSIFPNIAHTNATIYINAPNNDITQKGLLSIVDISGKQRYHKQIFLNQPSDSIHLSDIQLNSGIYFIRLAVDEKIYLAKLIVLD